MMLTILLKKKKGEIFNKSSESFPKMWRKCGMKVNWIGNTNNSACENVSFFFFKTGIPKVVCPSNHTIFYHEYPYRTTHSLYMFNVWYIFYVVVFFFGFFQYTLWNHVKMIWKLCRTRAHAHTHTIQTDRHTRQTSNNSQHLHGTVHTEIFYFPFSFIFSNGAV